MEELPEGKKEYKIENNEFIKNITIYTTKDYPETRCYLTANYSKTKKSIIIIGGTTSKCEQYNCITSFNPKNNKWEFYNYSNDLFDAEITGHSCNIILENLKEKLFIFGGFNSTSDNYTTHCYLINIEDMIFNQIDIRKNSKNLTEFPSKRSYHTSNYDKEKNIIYIYGGTDMNISNSKNESFQSIWEFDLNRKCWDKIMVTNPISNGVPRGHTSILFNNKLYIFGGVVLFKKFTNILYSIDLNSKEIENINYEGNVNPVAFHSAILISDKSFIIQGGLDKNYNVVNDCYIYNFETNTFTKINIPLIPKVFGHKLAFNEEEKKIYIVGGMDNFKYVGDENLIYQPENINDDLFDKNEEELIFYPMKQIFEMELVENI